MSNYKTDMVNEVVAGILKAGYRPFVAEQGHYGFFTDKEGSRVICFGVDLLTVYVSGNYITDSPKSCGTGWRISEGFHAGNIDNYFNACAPNWAVLNSKWRYTTLNEHLKAYQASSKYTEIFNQDLDVANEEELTTS